MRENRSRFWGWAEGRRPIFRKSGSHEKLVLKEFFGMGRWTQGRGPSRLKSARKGQADLKSADKRRRKGAAYWILHEMDPRSGPIIAENLQTKKKFRLN
jgi:hypothetical protein